MLKKQKHPSGETICFDKDLHLYFLESDSSVRFTPVTKIINDFFPKFQKFKIATKYARKHGMERDEVIKQWDDRRILGNMCHAFAQDKFEGRDTSEYNTASFKHLSTMDNNFSGLLESYDFVAAEYIVANLDLRVAGTIDLIMRTDDTLFIIDWKTNKAIDIYNPWENCLPPIEHLDASKYNRYSIQLNLYKFLLTSSKYFDIDNYSMKLLHVKPNDIEHINIYNMNIKKLLSYWKKYVE